jgi:hypothetical protein
VVPAFRGEAVNSGVFTLPLYSGAPPLELLYQVGEASDWREVLESAVATRKLKLIETGSSYASVDVLLLDAQRYGEWNRPEWRPPPDGGYLPERKLHAYAREAPTKPMRSLLVGGEGSVESLVEDASMTFSEAIRATAAHEDERRSNS